MLTIVNIYIHFMVFIVEIIICLFICCIVKEHGIQPDGHMPSGNKNFEMNLEAKILISIFCVGLLR